MRILSISVTHDSSVCSIVDGEIEFFCKEERLSRIKRDKAPFKALELYAQQQFGKIDKIICHTPSNYDGSIDNYFVVYLRKKFGVEPENYSSLTHHECHASLAFYNSGFKEALTFVIDRNGSILFGNNGDEIARESETVMRCAYPSSIIPIHKSFFTVGNNVHHRSEIKKYAETIFPTADIKVNPSFGIVKVYEAATTLIGQNALENGKTMGLASYGSETQYEPLFQNNEVTFNKFSHVIVENNGEMETSCFYGDEDKIVKELTVENYQYYADKAKQVQLSTQTEVLQLIKKYVETTGITNVCIVGGYGLNVVANNYYIKNLPQVNFYFEPLADDTGISIGAAMFQYKFISQDETIKYPKDNFYHFYKDEPLLNGTPIDIEKVVDMLIGQKSVAIFEGNPEAGPRALGHRSILFDPRNVNSKELINEVKNREWYRPFAGVVLEEDFNEYFETLDLKKSEYMTVSFDCKEKAIKEIPGVVHIDNTCRVQTVSSGTLYEILSLFKKKTGCSVLLNTSFNLAGEPLVQTKEEAINVLNNSKLNCVYFVDDKKCIVK